MAGKSNARWIRVSVDDAAGTARDISTDVRDVNIPIEHAESDVTGYSDGVVNVTLGHASHNVEMTGVFNNTASTGAYTVLSGIVGHVSSTKTVTVQIGINAAPTTGDPEYEGEFYCSAFKINGDLTWDASFRPASSTAPAWGTV